MYEEKKIMYEEKKIMFYLAVHLGHSFTFVDFTDVQAASVSSTFTGWKAAGGKKILL